MIHDSDRCCEHHPSLPGMPALQAKQDATQLQEQSKGMKKEVEAAGQRVEAAAAARDKALLTIGNLVHDSVPVDNDEVRPSCCTCVENITSVPLANKASISETA